MRLSSAFGAVKSWTGRHAAVALAMLPILGAAAPAQNPTPMFRLAVRVDPTAGTVAVQGRLDHFCAGDSARLYLSPTLRFQELRDASGPLSVRFDTAAPPMPFAEGTRPLVLARRACDLEFAYAGHITDADTVVNRITPDLVEIASYAGWYPASPSLTTFDFDVTITLPAGFVVAANGEMDAPRVQGVLQTIRVRSVAPTFDIAFVASPKLKTVTRSAGGVTVELFTATPDATEDTRLIDELTASLELFERWFGPAPVSQSFRVVSSPRDGWSYSRLPMIVGSGLARRRRAATPLGPVTDMRGVAHELAHFWWAIADVATTNDWINEGLAEYSAFAAASAAFGAAARDSLLGRYRQDAAQSAGGVPIAATATESPDRYVNRYEKPTLLLADVEDRVGAERLHAALRAFYARFEGTRGATTEAFLDTMGGALGDEVASRLRRCLVEIAWRESCPG